MSVPPVRGRSSEDRARSRAQLRLTFACRRKTNTEEPNSVEKGTLRRKAPAPIKVCFAGAYERVKSVPPASHRSSEDRVRPCAQLRLTFACRRKTDTEEPTSVEKGAHRRKALAPVRFVFAGADAGRGSCSPIRIRSMEDSVRIRAQFRLTFACRRKTNTEEPNSVEKGAHRRKVPAPVRVVFAGAGASVKRSPPASSCSSDERMRICAQLRLVLGNRRTLGYWHRSSCESAGTGGCHFQADVSPVKGSVVGSRWRNEKSQQRWNADTTGDS